MQVEVVTIDDVLYRGPAVKVIAKTAEGEISVLDDHLPIVTMLLAAPLRIVAPSGEETTLDIKSGFMEVRPAGRVVILAEN